MTDLPAIRTLARGAILIATAAATSTSSAAFLRRAVGVGVGGSAGGACVGVGDGNSHSAFLLLAGGTAVGVALDALELLFDLLFLEGVELGVAGRDIFEETVRGDVSINWILSVGNIQTWSA